MTVSESKIDKSLADMEDGETGTIVKVGGGHGLQERLQSMGVRPGKTVKKISGQPLRGPVAVEIGNFCVALGHGMARRIMAACAMPKK